MRVLVISDVHGNLEAMDAVLEDAAEWTAAPAISGGGAGFEMIWCLGDLVGYGPQPNECIMRLREFPHLAIAGNHDWGTLGRIDLAEFNSDARRANLWTRQQLTPESWRYLEGLPELLVEGEVTLAHGSPRQPVWEYLVYTRMACENFGYFDTKICLVGHSHLPVIFVGPNEKDDCRTVSPLVGTPVTLGDERYIINPGSVGQPRDGDARAAYMLIDTDSLAIEHRRVAYDVGSVQERMRDADLPPRSITRLQYGW